MASMIGSRQRTVAGALVVFTITLLISVVWALAVARRRVPDHPGGCFQERRSRAVCVNRA